MEQLLGERGRRREGELGESSQTISSSLTRSKTPLLMEPVSSTTMNSSEPPLAVVLAKGLSMPLPPLTPAAAAAAEEEEEPALALCAAAACAAAAAAAAVQTMVHLGHPAPTPSRSIRVEAAPPRQEP